MNEINHIQNIGFNQISTSTAIVITRPEGMTDEQWDKWVEEFKEEYEKAISNSPRRLAMIENYESKD